MWAQQSVPITVEAFLVPRTVRSPGGGCAHMILFTSQISESETLILPWRSHLLQCTQFKSHTHTVFETAFLNVIHGVSLFPSVVNGFKCCDVIS
jgi:hypothetical protein